MKTIRKYIFSAAALLALGAMAAVLPGCVTGAWSMPSAARLVELGIVTPDADLAALDRGRAMAIVDCRDCHRQYWPQQYETREWSHLAIDMGRRASMNEKQIGELRRYLIAASKTPRPETVEQ